MGLTIKVADPNRVRGEFMLQIGIIKFLGGVKNRGLLINLLNCGDVVLEFLFEGSNRWPSFADIIYDRAGYEFAIDYTKNSAPPLSEEDRSWSDSLLIANGYHVS
jgi:hypothetical protein